MKSAPQRLWLTVYPVVIVAVIAAVALTGLYISQFGERLPPERGDWGTFGDFMGGTLNPIIGLATVYLLVKTLVMQRNGLLAQQEELRETQDALASQTKAIAIQSFEQTFFSWLSSYRTIVGGMKYFSGQIFGGSHGLAVMLDNTVLLAKDECRLCVQMFDRGESLNDDERRYVVATQSGVMNRWKNVYDGHEYQLSSMLRTLYRLIRWIDEHPQLEPAERYQYVAIVRSQMTKPEQEILCLNVHTEIGRRFATLVNKYALLDNLRIDRLPVIDFVCRLAESPLSASAFDSDAAKARLAEEVSSSGNEKSPPS